MHTVVDQDPSHQPNNNHERNKQNFTKIIIPKLHHNNSIQDTTKKR